MERYLAVKHGLPTAHQAHTNFKLGAAGEPLLLSRADGTLADLVSARPIPGEHSLGRQPDGLGQWVYFPKATPWAPNLSPGFTNLTQEPSFSVAGGFHSREVTLAIAASEAGAKVHYTLDGSAPEPTSPEYVAPLRIRSRAGETNVHSMIPTADIYWIPPAGEVAKATVVRARAFKPGCLASQVVTHTYFVGEQLTNRYTLPVFALATAAGNLFDYDRGIYVPGRIYDEHYNPALPYWARPANYTQRGYAWERPVSVELFEQQQRRWLINAGLRLHGGATRANPRKSLQVEVGSAPSDELRWQAFPGLAREDFPTFLLRSGGNDANQTVLRDGFMQSLGADLGLATQAYRPALVFLNGEYWGLHNLRETSDLEFLTAHYDVAEDEVDLLESNLKPLAGDVLHYRRMLLRLEDATPNDPAAYAEVLAQMDVRNFTDYQLLQIFFANTDWPQGNIRYWRKRTPGPVAHAPEGHDGRWRWLMYDTDVGFGLVDPATHNTLAHATAANTNSTLLLRSLLQFDEFRQGFANRCADLLNSVLRPAYSIARLDQMAAVIEPEIPEHTRRWRAPRDLTQWRQYVQGMRAFAQERPAAVRQHFMTQFGLPGTAVVSLSVSDTNQGRLQINALVLDHGMPGVDSPSPWQGTYFRGVPIQVRALPRPGYRLAGWIGAASKASELVVTLTADLALTAVFEPDAHPLAWVDYGFTEWPADAPAGTYPARMYFEQTDALDPGLGVAMTGWWQLPYNLESRSRINGLGAEGVAFLNTSTPQEAPEAGLVGTAVLGLSTLGVKHIRVGWTGGTVAPNDRVYGLRLQYRVGAAGLFADVLDAQGQPVDYLRRATAGHSEVLGPTLLPAAVEQQPRVELRWKYHHVSGTNGARAQLRLDDIRVSGEPQPGWIRHPVFGWLWNSGNGWNGSSAYGWMWFHPGGQWIWSTSLDGWLAILNPNYPAPPLWSTQFRWLTPSVSDPYQAHTTSIGAIHVGQYQGSVIAEGWVVSARFGYVWAAGDGVWFYTTGYGWLGVTPEGGIWSINEGRFL